MTKHRPTSDEKRIIRECAKRETGKSRIIIEPGIRHHLNDVTRQNMNIAMLSDDPDFGDTDLWDHSTWAIFASGFELTPDGRAIVDFYVYSTGPDGELESNVVAYWSAGKLVRVDGVGCDGLYLNE